MFRIFKNSEEQTPTEAIYHLNSKRTKYDTKHLLNYIVALGWTVGCYRGHGLGNSFKVLVTPA